MTNKERSDEETFQKIVERLPEQIRYSVTYGSNFNQPLEELLTSGWSVEAIGDSLSAQNWSSGMAFPAGVLIHRLKALKAVRPRQISRGQPFAWCGACDERTRYMNFDSIEENEDDRPLKELIRSVLQVTRLSSTYW